jgi:ArsR family transcriptional regulator, arsenate/arsenite/antimonite-responsive transcriptional repressor
MSRAKPFDIVRLFAALADHTRLRLLNLMRGRGVCVCYFVEILQQSQPRISRHLAYLRNAGIVSARRDGKWMHYSIRRPQDSAAASILDAGLASLVDDKNMLADLMRLDRASCAPEKFVALEGVPSPVQMIS